MSPSEPALPALDAAPELGPLVRREHLGGVREGVGDPLRSRVGELELVIAQRVDARPVHSRRRQRLADLAPAIQVLLTQREHVVRGFFEDRSHFVALLLGGIDAPQHAVDHPLHAPGHETVHAAATHASAIAPAARAVVAPAGSVAPARSVIAPARPVIAPATPVPVAIAPARPVIVARPAVRTAAIPALAEGR